MNKRPSVTFSSSHKHHHRHHNSSSSISSSGGDMNCANGQCAPQPGMSLTKKMFLVLAIGAGVGTAVYTWRKKDSGGDVQAATNWALTGGGAAAGLAFYGLVWRV